MSEINKLRKDLPPMETTFQVEETGELTKKRYVGEFSCKIMNKKEQAMVAKHKAFLNGDMAQQLDFATLKLHHQISYLRYALTEYPLFWKNSDLGYELYDMNVIEAVYNQVLKFEEDWITQVWGPEAVKALKGQDGREEKSESEESQAEG